MKTLYEVNGTVYNDLAKAKEAEAKFVEAEKAKEKLKAEKNKASLKLEELKKAYVDAKVAYEDALDAFYTKYNDGCECHYTKKKIENGKEKEVVDKSFDDINDLLNYIFSRG